MKHEIGLGFCVVLCVIGAFAEKTMKMQPDGNKARIAQMGALEGEERIELLRQLSKQRSDIQRNLIQQLGDSKSKDMKCAVAYLLGRYRMERSVPELSKYITLEYEHHSNWKREPLWGQRPVVEALIKIGRPAISDMIRNIETSEYEKVRQFSARVIRYVEGPEIAKVIVEMAIEKQPDERKKENLRAALSYFLAQAGR